MFAQVRVGDLPPCGVLPSLNAAFGVSEVAEAFLNEINGHSKDSSKLERKQAIYVHDPARARDIDPPIIQRIWDRATNALLEPGFVSQDRPNNFSPLFGRVQNILRSDSWAASVKPPVVMH